VAETTTPSQTVGPFFSIGMDAFLRQEIAGDAGGQRVTVRGRVLDGDAQPVPDAVLEIWAPGAGAEKTTADGYPAGFGRIATNERGEFQFAVTSHARREQDGAVHAPHLAVVIFMRGLLRHLVTRVYFADDAANEHDPVLQLVAPDRRATLIAAALPGKPAEFSWDIHLQGENETVFFDM
jgi:protocatechuate 3,4-dioxygenase alpha subunit